MRLEQQMPVYLSPGFANCCHACFVSLGVTLTDTCSLDHPRVGGRRFDTMVLHTTARISQEQ